MNTISFEELWWLLYQNIFIGKVAMVIACVFLLVSILFFVRWRMVAMSMIMLTLSLIIAYADGIIMIFNGSVS